MRTPALRRRAGVAMLALVATAVFSGCSGGESAQDAETESTGSPTTVASNVASTSAPSESSKTDGPIQAFPWLPDIVLLTEPSDDLRPLLAWEPVDNAATYSVTVTAPTGVAYWAWQTDTTSVHLGGDPRLDDDQSGPATLPGMTWSVLAFDTNGRPLAASVEATLHP